MKATQLLIAASLSLTSLGAMAAGQSSLGEVSNYPAQVQAPSQSSGLTRAQVLAELNATQGSTLGELYDYPASVQQPSNAPALTRAQVQAELAAQPNTQRSGGIDYPGAF